MLSRVISRRLIGALAVSALLHWLFVSGNANWLPDLLPGSDPIEVSLVPSLSPPVVPLPQAAPEVKQYLKPALKPQPKPQSISKPVEPPPPAPPLPSSAPVEAAPVIATSEPPPAMEERIAPVESPPSTVEDDPEPVPPAPRTVKIEFVGNNGSGGSGEQRFERLDNGRYTIISELGTFLSLEQRSEGLITPTGLQPGNFRQKITFRKPQTATFDWANKKVALDNGKRVETVDLPSNTQDFLSFMYQFMFVPPLDQMHLNLTDGKQLKTYLYEFEGEDTLSTKIGALRTWHITKSSRDNDRKTELWLALDYRYLPVRIRYTEKDGKVTDVIVSNLKVEP
jgi:hypothetical protein